MATEILQKAGTNITWADSGTFAPDASNLTQSHQITLTSLADGAARQGAKGDFGAVRAAKYAVMCRFELDVAPVAGTAIYVYWAASPDNVAANDNPGGASGLDALYAAADEAEFLKQLTLIGIFICTADVATVVQIQVINDAFTPPTRYGMPVVYNKAGQALEGDAIEQCVSFLAIVDEVQD